MVRLKKEGVPLNLIIIGADSENTDLDQYIAANNMSESVWMYGESYNE